MLEIYEEFQKLSVVLSRHLEPDASLEGLRVVLLQAAQTKPVARGVVQLVPPAPTRAAEPVQPASHCCMGRPPCSRGAGPGSQSLGVSPRRSLAQGGRALTGFPQPTFSMVVWHTSLRTTLPSPPSTQARPRTRWTSTGCARRTD